MLALYERVLVDRFETAPITVPDNDTMHAQKTSAEYGVSLSERSILERFREPVLHVQYGKMGVPFTNSACRSHLR